MAGMLPGVELARRRRTHYHQCDCKPREPSLHHLSTRIHPTTAMDETALRARRRLEEKLRGSTPSSAPALPAPPPRAPASGVVSRRRTNPNYQSRSTTKAAQAQVTDIGFLRLQRWSSRLQRQKSQKEVCAICLDEFQTEQQIISLPCFHKYHSNCLLPWLNAQSHCPYCRTHIPS